MKFKQAISAYKRNWVIGRCFRAMLLLAAVFLVLVIAYALVDVVWALENDTRAVVNRCLIGAAILAAVVVIVRLVRTSLATLSSAADLAVAGKGNRVRAAYDLSQKEADSDLQSYLAEQAQADAAKEVRAIPLKKVLSLRAIGVGGLVLAGVAGLSYGLRFIHPPQYDVVVQRLLHPDRDIPPYSPLRFRVSQDSENTVYGADNQVRVEITGGEIKHDVVCLVRNKRTGEIDSINTFQESANVFSKKFANILTDMDFAFACGKARSEWKSISVLLQPKFTEATIKITPPSYTGRKAIEFTLEGNELNVIHGSKIELTVRSNRPLSAGEVAITPEKITGLEARKVAGNVAERDTQSLTFSWQVDASSQVSCQIFDVRQTASAAPLEFHIVARADLAPVAELTSPARFVLATPSSKIPLRGNVEDDYAVESVHLVRTLVGFRDRAKELATAVQKDYFDFTSDLDLRAIGVEAGQMIELYLEANDQNPSLLGIGTSDVVRVQIISEDEYAKRLRDKAKIEQFNIRYRVLAQAVRDAIKSLRDLEKANQANIADEFNKKNQASQKVHRNSRAIAQRIAEDFQAFDLEQKLTEKALALAEKLLTNYDQLTQLDFKNGADHNKSEIAEMIERLGGLLEEIEQIEQDAKDMQQWGAVAKQAAVFKKMFQNQRSIGERITRIAKEVRFGQRRNVGQLKLLGETQHKMKGHLLKFKKDLTNAAAALPPRFADLQGDCEIWLEKLEELNIPDAMDATTMSANVGKSDEAATNALLAYSLMKQLVDMEDNQFAEMLRNKVPENKENEDIQKTMEQLLDAMHQQHGQGQGQQQGQGQPGDGNGRGGGRGLGGGGGGRGLMRNQDPPMFGPGRTEFGQGLGSGRGSGNGSGQGKGNGAKPKVSENNSIDSQKRRDTKTSQSTRTNVPSKYKDAVKKFYSDLEK